VDRPQGGDLAGDQLFPAVPSLAHQTGAFQHDHVFLDPGVTHREPPGEIGHRVLTVHHQGEDLPTGAVGEGMEDPVGMVRAASSYNHQVAR
jgi:hypothetical protein